MSARRLLGLLRALGTVELVTLAAMLVNLATVHHPVLTKGLGPVHGLAYCGTVVVAMLLAQALDTPAARRGRWLAVVPGLGGLLAARALGRRSGERTLR